MKLFDLPAEVIAELNALDAVTAVDITSKAVRNSAFYRAIQTEEVLDVSYSGLKPATLLLVARIAATSHTLHTININMNNLGKHAPATAAVFEDHNNQYLADLNTLIHQNDSGLPIGMPTALVDLIGSYVSVPID